MNPVRLLLRGSIRAYQYVVSPWLGDCCRYHPTCSQYALDAIDEHGALKGSFMAAWRICRCNPYSPGGVDPVPPRH